MIELLTQGEKLKKLRKELNLKQSDIATPNITREFISMVENGKRNLSNKSSKELVEFIASKYELENPNDYFFFSRTLEEDIIYYFENNSLKELNELKQFKTIIEKFNVPEIKMKVCYLIANSYGKSYLYEESKLFYYESLQYAYKLNDLEYQLKIFNNLGAVLYELCYYQDSIYFYNEAIKLSTSEKLEHNLDYYNKYIESIVYNLLLSYNQLDDYISFYNLIKKFSKFLPNKYDSKYDKFYIIAILFLEKSKYYEDYNSLIESVLETNSTELKRAIFTSKALNNYRKNNLDTSLKLVEESVSIKKASTEVTNVDVHNLILLTNLKKTAYVDEKIDEYKLYDKKSILCPAILTLIYSKLSLKYFDKIIDNIKLLMSLYKKTNQYKEILKLNQLILLNKNDIFQNNDSYLKFLNEIID